MKDKIIRSPTKNQFFSQTGTQPSPTEQAQNTHIFDNQIFSNEHYTL